MGFTDKFKFIKTCVEHKCPTTTALTAIDTKFGKNMGDRPKRLKVCCFKSFNNCVRLCRFFRK